MKSPLLAASLLLLASWGQGEQRNSSPATGVIEVRGTITLTGSHFPMLVIDPDSGPSYEIVGEWKEELLQRQGQTVTVRGLVGPARGGSLRDQLRVISILD